MDARKDRRQRLTDRRKFTGVIDTPSRDNRKIPDRRLNNIRVEWIDEVPIGH